MLSSGIVTSKTTDKKKMCSPSDYSFKYLLVELNVDTVYCFTVDEKYTTEEFA